MPKFIPTSSFGIEGDQYYWKNRSYFGISEDELKILGITSNDAFVRVELKEPLLAADAIFRHDGYRLYIKDGYRSYGLYDLINQKRAEKLGAYDTNRSLNMKRRPHATGFTVDIALISLFDNKEVLFRDQKDGVDAFFINYYNNEGKHHPNAQDFLTKQKYLRTVMFKVGWRLGELNEIWHFEWPHDENPASLEK